jgi:Putative metallopeptidase
MESRQVTRAMAAAGGPSSLRSNTGVAMKRILKAALSALAAACLMSLAPPALAQVSPEFSNSKIVLFEKESGDRGYWTTGLGRDAKEISPERMELRERMMKRRVLEDFAEFLSPLRLPYTLRMIASDCSGSAWDSPYYDPRNHLINMCYSFVAASEKNADELMEIQKTQQLWTPVTREQLVAGLFAAVLLHETGHAVFDLLNVPVFGREEDAADFAAAFIALQFGKDIARTVIKGFAYYWAYEAASGADPRTTKPDPKAPNYPKDADRQCHVDPFCAYSDEHGTASQRMYNVICLAYGGDPATFKDFVDIGWLPKERAATCVDEYRQLSFAFEKTILPFLDLEQLKKVRARNWFTPAELKDR